MRRGFFPEFLAARWLLPPLFVLATGAAAAADEADDYVRSEMESQHIPGLEFALLRDGQIIKAGAYGQANVELQVPVKPDTKFPIASMSKPVVASAVMLLVQDGKLSLDDPITKFIPGLPETWKTITLRHLMAHTSGIKDRYQDYPFFPKLGLNRRLDYSEEELVRAFADAGLNFPPGKQWAYSGSGYALLGMVISKVTGKPYAEFLRERIFAPLGMSKTQLISLRDITPDRAAGYDWDDGKLTNGGYTSQSFLNLGDTSILSTATDVARWLRALEDHKLWKSSSTDAMWTPARLSNGREAAVFPFGSYGLGWYLGLYKDHKLIGHTGGLPGFTSVMFYFPEQHLNSIVLDNQWEANSRQIALGLAGLVDPVLIPPHRMNPMPDPHPELSAKVKGFLTAFFGGGDATSFVTPGLRDHLHPVPKPPQKPPPIESRFIATEKITGRNLSCYGSKVAEMSYYKAQVNGDEHYLTIYFNQDGQIADFSGY